MNQEFLFEMLDTMSVSGHEIDLQKKIIAHMKPYAHEIRTDYTGDVICVLNPEADFKVLLTGHVDEIGLIVTHIRPDGLLKVARAGGIRPCAYPGHQVLVGKRKIPGVVVLNEAMTKGDIKAKDLLIDIGAKDGEDARKYVEEGDPICLHTYHLPLQNGLLCARAIDDRAGVFIVMEALKAAKERGCEIGVYAAATVGEETTMRGAYWSASRVKPDVAIAVDVTYAQDYPGTDPAESGDVRLGGGPVLCNSSIASRKVNDLLKGCAKAKNIPCQIESFPGHTGTDADKMHQCGDGVVTALLSLPLRYMHAPGEVCQMQDVEAAIALLTEFLCTINSRKNLDPFE